MQAVLKLHGKYLENKLIRKQFEGCGVCILRAI